MLQGINRIGQSWVGRAVVTVMFGFLIASFAIWGIGDIFRGQVKTQVATVGGRDISAEAFRSAYQNEYQNLIRRTRQTVTPDQARQLGLDRQVLGRMVTESALDEEARRMRLAVPDASIAQAIQADPNFRGINGQFDRAQFGELLRSNGVSEAQYVRDQRAVAARFQLAESVSGSLPVPVALREAVHRYANERRALDYVVLTPALLGELPAPSDAQLQAFFDDRKGTYRAPEYRAISLLVLDAEALAKPADVTDADARSAYERLKGTRFGTPERRTIQQIVFTSPDEAAAASSRIREGAAFADIAKERNLDDATLNLGTFAKSEMLDPAAAEAAFALPEDAVSDPVSGRFGTVLVRVVKVEAGSVRPFAEVIADVKREVALERARADLQRVHDAIEDQRAGAKPLPAIAEERGLALTRVAAVDRQGRDKAGAVAALPDPAPLLQAAFRSDIGADNEALRTGGDGYVWFDVTGVEPARDRSFAEVRERVDGDWRAETTAQRLADKGRELAAKLDGGASVADVAADAALKAETAGDLSRSSTNSDLTRAVVTRAFATPVGKAADVAVDAGRRVLFKVASAAMPPFPAAPQEAAASEDQLRAALAEDVLAQYIAVVEKGIGVSTFPENVRRAIGGET